MPVLEYKCPGCGSGMVFDVDSGKLTCSGCGRQDNILQIPDVLTSYVFSEEDVAKEYCCNNCGAVIIADHETSATTCKFCDSPVVLSERLTGKLAPAKIIPFTVSEEEAVKAFRKWCKRGLFTPARFKPADRIKKLTAMYVPFWLYNLHSDVEVQATGKKNNTYTSGDYEYTDTKYYDVYRKICLEYVKVPVDAAEKMDDRLMDHLEPFPYDRLEDFSTAYLSGYIAEKYSYNEKELFPRVKTKIREYIDDYIDGTMSEYDSVSYQDISIDTRTQQAQYVLLPVWIVLYDFDKTEHTFALNGRTGKVAGKPPVSRFKVTCWFTGISALFFISLQELSSWIIDGRLPW
ncbi:TFIIB-type zinc ribbon-containing protein [Paenibacillus chibensis]|uniref:TFIIB-type zinc ribbon-containing protein n=1 Tax=Paenibacillus chibensis TaxID=59846 RepID=UPI000FD8BC0C|nr:TFIIB-type zinc ribbon-containing protein [Paenibacillus chibensis]MEC0371782.1 TFIIB-type zinc ribbon-containing protein [Paenibacillus chibensis]